jgi:2-(1,2-epoxy-1,2-dihydrophenyl)acetyl-CoA isomerase
MGETVIQEHDGALAILTLNRPDKLNSFTMEMTSALKSALAEIAADRACRALLITGAGRAFCAGQDLSERLSTMKDQPADIRTSLDTRFNPLVRSLRNLPKPIVVAVNGVAAGAGANFALQGDIVLAAKSAQFIQSFVKIGLAPDCGGTWSLTRLIGEARAKALALSGEPLPATQAAEWGLIWKAVDDAELMAQAKALAKRLAAGPAAATAAIKRLIHAAAVNDMDAQLDLEREEQHELGLNPDFGEGVAAFLEKRPAVFKGEA